MTFDPSTIKYKKQHFVNGEFRSDEEGTFDYVRPSDQKLLDKNSQQRQQQQEQR